MGDGVGVQPDLAAWLLACIEADRDAATAASPGPWHPNAEQDEVLAVDDETVCDGFALSNNQLRATVGHIVAWDPARVLVECDTKRQVIELHQPTTLTGTVDGREVAESRCVKCADRYPCQTLRLQTLPFVERDGYREEWRP